jgi:hypothetical protein
LAELPKLPTGMKSAAFGQAIGWGTGDAAARERARTITLEEIHAVKLTREMAVAWRDLYEKEAERTSNPSAEGRRDLMQRIIDLLDGSSP